MKDNSQLKHFLGLEVDRTEERIFLCQQKYTNNFLKKFGILESKPIQLQWKSMQNYGHTKQRLTRWNDVSTIGRKFNLPKVDLTKHFICGGSNESVHAKSKEASHGNDSANTKICEKYNRFRFIVKKKVKLANWLTIVMLTWDKKSTTGYVFKIRFEVVFWCGKRQPIVSSSTKKNRV